MSLYKPVGVTDAELIFKSTTTDESSALFDLLRKASDAVELAKLKLQNAFTGPEVAAAQQELALKKQQLDEAKRRAGQKSDMLLWGGVAAAVLVGFLVLRKK